MMISQIISQLDQITSLNLDGSKRLTDKGLQYLARMPQLRELILGGQITDHGLEALQPPARIACLSDVLAERNH